MLSIASDFCFHSFGDSFLPCFPCQGLVGKMSSPRPKSPRTPVLPKKEDKEESFWDKIGTIGRKKRIKEGKHLHLLILPSDWILCGMGHYLIVTMDIRSVRVGR